MWVGLLGDTTSKKAFNRQYLPHNLNLLLVFHMLSGVGGGGEGRDFFY